jgi:glutaminyl-peptide cyclotransferase
MNNVYMLVAAVAGAGIALQLIVNTHLRMTAGSAVWAAAIQFFVGLTGLVVVGLALRERASLPGLSRAPWWIWIGGLLGATYILVSVLLSRRLGAAVLLASTVVGQLSAALLIDHYGWLGAPIYKLSFTRVLGVILLVAGVVVMRWPVPSLLEAAVQQEASKSRTPVYSYDVITRYPHDAGAFTQGLIYRDGILFESTGLNGKSSLRKVRLETGEVLQRHDLEKRYFGEGLTEFGGELFQLTWDSGVGFIYDRDSLAFRRRFSYRGEGWGLTHDGTRLILSDGTATLRVLDPKTLQVIERIRVTDRGAPVDALNELEFVRGRIYANVWFTDRIAMIDPASGDVTGWIDLAGLGPYDPSVSNAVLNGIAYDSQADRLFVTGKLWPTLFEIRIRENKAHP